DRAMGLAEAATVIAHWADKWKVPPHRISFDRVGIGRDLQHHLKRLGIHHAIGYAGSAGPRSPLEFTNLRTEAAWALRRRLNPDWRGDPAKKETVVPFHIPAGAWLGLLTEELGALTYDLVGYQTRLIPKEALCARLGRSPDRADALIQSFAFA